ncbi:MAG: pyridoxal 5'-phosphate synthase glutaminase subunit PdxT [Candidatus Hadarchaeum sp.]|uniref:pyridoxal 5'-phosphate synthase glutaminase subunit PdxT n=1 Tax=Candidatus Hadarchaeum sp. TaxID=2883567 RepID=UPI003D102062
MMRIGVIGLQGAVSEHIEAVRRALVASGQQGEAVWVARPEQLEGVDGIIIPGGESTTIGKLMKITEIFDAVKRLAESGVPLLGTCAGMVVLAKRGDEQVARTKQPLLGLMDIAVVRNAFGRQRESFEAELNIPILGEKPFPGVFIRAPVVKEVWGDAEVIAEFMGKIVGVKQRNMVAVAFHPELTTDTRLHEYFLRMCRGQF